MVNVVGPLMSLAATGNMKDALFYYDTKFGARIRVPKRQFSPPGQAWIVNQEWFKLANQHSKGLSGEQRLAWKIAYPGKCDTWRDIFMGKQIEFWNLSPQNDLTWPPVEVQSVGTLVFRKGSEFEGSVYIYLQGGITDVMRRNTIGLLFWDILDVFRAPVDSDAYKFKTYAGYEIPLESGHTNYIWAGVRYLNGKSDAYFVNSFVR